ncbi:MAG: glycogen debranching enzyme, partial [Candidatus Hydrogenedentes bacterium]|nr:glycogen debranching enzyme [Candidatus Hydrogenedentota bacterium]
DIYEHAGRPPCHSVNFITCHDGFTLRDLVSYARKHNLDNGEGNRDGSNDNLSINCGFEGDGARTWVNDLRLQMQKNHLCTLFLSLGVPMLLGGDEFGRTQQGNNNAYCQDNAVSWFNWDLLKENEALFRFCKALIAFRKAQPAFTRQSYFEGDGDDVLWYGPDRKPVDWSSSATLLAYQINDRVNGGATLYAIFNNTESATLIQLPPGGWELCINTALRSPRDIQWGGDLPCDSVVDQIESSSRSVIVLRQSLGV